jgi:hypothetical protein
VKWAPSTDAVRAVLSRWTLPAALAIAATDAASPSELNAN